MSRFSPTVGTVWDDFFTNGKKKLPQNKENAKKPVDAQKVVEKVHLWTNEVSFICNWVYGLVLFFTVKQPLEVAPDSILRAEYGGEEKNLVKALFSLTIAGG